MGTVNIIEALVSWQGEGVDAGQRMLILRFKRCNRACKFCDTQMKMRAEQEMKMTTKDIQKIIDVEKCGILVTGGEPTFSTNLKQTVDIINNVNCKLFNIETNGCKLVKLIEEVNPEKNIHYSLSPKIFNNKDLEEYIPIIENIKDNPKVFIKLVYEQRDLLIKFLEHLKTINFDNQRVFLMPEGTSREILLDHASMVFDVAEKYHINFSSRDHVIYQFT